MISPYLFRLLCLSLASFFLVHLAAGLAVSLAASAAVRWAERMRPRLAARFLITLRLLPLGFAIFVVAALCVPSYLLLEPEASAEQVGWPCLAAGGLAIYICGLSGTRALCAIMRSIRYGRHCERVGRKTLLARQRAPLWIVDGASHLLALAGVIRPKMVVSSDVVKALTVRQLSAALRHEHAHRISHDNLKRLLILAAPDIFPFDSFRSGFSVIEHGWARFTEWAADDQAVAGSSGRSLSLAAALVSVARMGVTPPPSSLVTLLMADTQDLSARVDRLLRAAPRTEKPGQGRLAIGSVLIVAGSLGAILLHSAILSSVHEILERLID